MRTTEPIAKSASTPKAGFVAMLRGLLHVEGTSAPKISQGSGARTRLLLAALATTLGALAFASAPALAAAPETPTLAVESKVPSPPSPSTEAVLHGVLNPGKVGVPGTYELDEYQFLYKAGASCAGGSLVPTTPGVSLGEGHEALPAETLTGLSVNTEYAVCLIVRNGAGPGHESSSAPVTFRTALPPEAPETISPAKLITATTATLEGVLNPKAAVAVKAGWYFAYNVGAGCVGGSTTISEAEATVKAASESKGVTGLQPNQKYEFCLVATNSAGEAVPGNEVSVETKPASPEVTGESTALPVKATEATLEAQVNPNNESTTYRFEYSTSATGETLNAPVTTLASATVLGGFGNQTAGVATGAVLAQDTTYYYRAVATNAAGATSGTVAHFKTAIAPGTPEGLKGEPTGPTTATLRGVLNPTKAGEAGTYEFMYKASESECTGANTTPEPAGPSSGSTPEGVEAKVMGLLPGVSYTFCLIAHNSAGETASSSPVTFTTLAAPPTIVSEYPSSVQTTAATLNAQIDPDGATTSYRFEYGNTEAYGQSTPATALTGLTGTETATATLTGLEPGTTYHYRVVATSSQSPGGTPGPDKTLTTSAAPGSTPAENCPNEQLRAEQPYGLGLPDCRAYEMVSPVEKNDKDAIDHLSCLGTYWPSRADPSGEAVAFDSPGSFAEPVGSRLCATYIARRAPDGWSTQNVTPPHIALDEYAGGGIGSPPFGDMYFSPNLALGLVTQQTTPLTSDTPLSAGGENVVESMYLADFAGGTSYRLVEALSTLIEFKVYPQPQAASPDLSHVLTEGMSDWVDGVGIPVDIGNHGESLGAKPGSGSFSGAGISELRPGDTWHALSADGKRVFMTSEGGNGNHDRHGRELLYVRENPEQPQSPVDGQGKCTVAADACTILISASRRKVSDPNGPYPVVFAGASADGSKVFFTTRMELTEDAYTGPEDNRPNLYEYDVESEELKDLTVDKADPKGAGVPGVVAISENGSYVYFVAMGKLAVGATSGKPNLYVSHEGNAPKFIATLNNSGTMEREEEEGNETSVREMEEGKFEGGDSRAWGEHVQLNEAAVSSDGSKLAFVSHRSLTGYDNEIAENSPSFCENNMCGEVYIYDASSGSLTCASCNPSGARPIGESDLTRVEDGETVQVRPRNFSEDGSRLFFDTYDALVPHDSNARRDVYEYEDGHVYPISNVADGHESVFLDASSNGNDVFIATAAQLLPQDKDTRIDIYDARVNGGFPVTNAPTVCDNGDACKPPPALQPGVFGAPASATFSGAGNVAPVPVAKGVVKGKSKHRLLCKHGQVRKRGRCVRVKTKRSSGQSKRGSK